MSFHSYLHFLLYLFGLLSGCRAFNITNQLDPFGELFVKSPDNPHIFIPLNGSDPSHWEPAPQYEGLPMKTMVSDNEVYYQVDFAVISTEQLRNHFLNSPGWENFTMTDEDIENQRALLLNSTKTESKMPSLKCRSDKDAQCIGFGPPCGDEIQYRYISQTTSQNLDIYGYYHYQSDKLCGPLSGTYSVSVSHQSGVQIIGGGSLPILSAKGVTSVLSKFLSVFAVSIAGPAPDTVTVGHSYSASCPAYSACFLWERPHFAVYKGWTQAIAYDPQYNVDCPNYSTQFNFELHVMWDNASWGMCYSTNGNGCGWAPSPPPPDLICPDPNM